MRPADSLGKQADSAKASTEISIINLIDSTKQLPDTATFSERKYKSVFTPDYVARPSIGYSRSNFGSGIFGGTSVQLSDMLGVSERNIDKFTMDTFVSCCESGFDWVGQTSVKNTNQWHFCKIRRLDGSSMVGEFIFQANVSPGRHLSRFRNVASCRHVPSQISKMGVGTS